MIVHEGQQVRISENYHWAKGATGAILMHPANGTLTRKVKARIGEIVFVWIRFDNAQLDGEGDGPYTEAEIDLAFVEISK